MARGYLMPDVRRRIIEELSGSGGAGVSGVQLSRALGISRTTVTKYLSMFESDGTLRKRDVGNITLWSLRPGQEPFEFPDDYFEVADRYMDCIRDASEQDALLLVRNCQRSGASAARLILDVIVPASDAIFEMYDTGKIGAAEQSLLHNIVYRSLFLLEGDGEAAAEEHGRPEKGAIVVAADEQSVPVSRAASAAYRSGGWSVFELGDMSSAAAGVLFDLDFQRLVKKVWGGTDTGSSSRSRHRGRGSKNGARGSRTLVVAVFSHTAEGLNFFADGMYPTVKKSRHMHLILCGRGVEETSRPPAKSCDHYVDGDVAHVLQWSDARAGRDG